MIPLSRDQMIPHDFDGVTYLFYPPVGDKEAEILSAFSLLIKSANPSAFYEQAVKDVDIETRGKRLKRGEYNKLVENKSVELSREKNDIVYEVKQINTMIDMVLAGWKSERNDAPGFPKDNSPSSALTIGVKKCLIDWYYGEIMMSETEAKNS